jgi:TatA/E family protein of Tat protein translocase
LYFKAYQGDCAMEGLFQPMHLLFILAIVLIIFGPGKLPDLGRGLGKGIREFKDALRGGIGGQAERNPNVTVIIGPAAANVPPSGTQQFQATVSGPANGGLTWSVNGVKGGNSVVGTISSSGLYTAPNAVPAPNHVTVSATSLADTSESASAEVTITSLA